MLVEKNKKELRNYSTDFNLISHAIVQFKRNDTLSPELSNLFGKIAKINMRNKLSVQ